MRISRLLGYWAMYLMVELRLNKNAVAERDRMDVSMER